MVQSALLGLCVSLLADLLPTGSGTRVDVATGARAELNAGRVPVTSLYDSEPGTEQTVVLRSGIRLISPTASLSLVYQPQYYLRLPDVLEVGRPLLLHDGILAWSARTGPRLTFNWDLRASAGELPSSGLLTVFDPGTGNSTSSVVPILRLNTNLSMNAVTGKRQTTSVSLNGSHNDSLGEATAMQKSDNASLSVSHSLGLSKRTSTGLSGQAGYAAPENESESVLLGGQLFVEQQLSPQSTLRAAGGISQAWALDGGPSWPLPTVDASYRTSFSGAGQTWGLNASTGTRAFFDATSARYRPQAFITVGLNAQILQVWTIASTLSFATDISGETPEPGEQPTQFNFTFPVSYRIDDNLRVSFGLRLALSGPPLNAWSSAPVQDQISFFIALDWRTGTEKTRGGWL